MLTRMNNSDTAVIVLHEINGINRHIVDACDHFHALGHAVHCPNMLGADTTFSYEQRDAAYVHFMANVGFAAAAASIEKLAATLRPQYKQVFLVGYSIGATIAWLAAGATACDGIVCHYGTRIRDYLAARPRCPALLIMAEQDAAFPAAQARNCFCGMPGVSLEILEGGHGFCDAYGPAYHPDSAKRAGELASRFFRVAGTLQQARGGSRYPGII